MRKLRIYVRLLSIYFLLSLAAIIILFIKYNRLVVPPEITVRRINIVAEDGSYRMVLSDEQNQHPGTVDGVTEDRERPAGIIFFNEQGDECGGLVYTGNGQDAGMVLSVDQYLNDQIMQFQYNEEIGASREYGLRIWEYQSDLTFSQRHTRLQEILQSHEMRDALPIIVAEKLIQTERIFLGRTAGGESGLFLFDDEGRLVVKICIDKQNNPSIIRFDENGETLKKLL